MSIKNHKISFALLIAAVVVFNGCSSKVEIKNDTRREISLSPSTMEASDTSTWETYTSTKYHFTLKHPREFQVSEGIQLEGTSSEHYSISFSKGFEYGFMAIAPDSTSGSRGVEKAKSYVQIIDGKKALIEEWPAGDGGSTANLKFLDPIDQWKMCETSEFCEHITFFGHQKKDSEIFKE